MSLELDYQKEKFKNHIAKFTDYGTIKIIDFKEPDTSEYRIRFLFEEDYCKLHITGDLGELIASNYNNMCLDGFYDYLNNTGYFESKIDCMSRSAYRYDFDKVKKDLKELFEEYVLEDEVLQITYTDNLEDAINEILEDFDYEKGIGSKGYDILEEMISDVWEIIGDIGKKSTNILEVYLLAFKLAIEQIKEKGELND